MKILLVMPGRGQITDRKPGRSISPPSPLLEVAGRTPEECDLAIHDELAEGPVSVETLDWADLVGISGLSTSHWGMIRVADLAKSLGKKVIGGGMHITGLCRENIALELCSHFDAVVVGHLTKRLWTEIIWDAEDNSLQSIYRADKDEPFEFVLPRHELIMPERYHLPAVIRSSAGCTEACDFCTVHTVCGRGVRVKPREIIEQELERIPKTGSIKLDLADSFGADYQHTINDVLPLYTGFGPWFTEITIKNLIGADNGREALLWKMAEAGFEGVYLGVENPFVKTGAKYVGREKIEQAIKLIHKAGMAVMVSEMLDVNGTETEKSIKEMVEWNIDQGVAVVQYSLTAALPGSALRRRMLKKNRIISRNWEHYDGAWPTVWHPILSAQRRIELLEYAYRRTYHPFIALKRVFGHPHPWFSLKANSVVGASVYHWWGRKGHNLGYDHWQATGGTEIAQV